MEETIASGIVAGVSVYLLVGLVFAVAFVLAGIGRVDRAAQGSSLGFRLLLLPGATALWPLLLKRWITGRGGP